MNEVKTPASEILLSLDSDWTFELLALYETEHVLSGLSESFKSRANSIAILHGDGTIAVYAHLQFRSIRFHEGMSVKAGEVIAKSGNTGYSTGPHLHFEVVKNKNMIWHSMPFEFMLDGISVVPQAGMLLRNIAKEDI